MKHFNDLNTFVALVVVACLWASILFPVDLRGSREGTGLDDDDILGATTERGWKVSKCNLSFKIVVLFFQIFLFNLD